MTENEAIKQIKNKACNERCISSLCNDGCMYGDEECAFSMAIKALEEIQQYRAIGTVEEIKEELSVADIQADKLNAYKKVGTIEEFKALKEKNTPNKIAYQGGHEKCPTCGSFHVFGKHCTKCGQVVDYD